MDGWREQASDRPSAEDGRPQERPDSETPDDAVGACSDVADEGGAGADDGDYVPV
jgi:hypothetical protein